MFKRFLIACDFSDQSLAAFRQSLMIAQALKAESVVVAHVLADFRKALVAMPAEERAQLMSGDMEKFQHDIRINSEAKLQELISTFSPTGLSLKTEILLGGASGALINSVMKEHHEVLVVGTRGIKGFKGLLIGSTAKQLIRNSPSAVWVSKGATTDTPKTIVVPVDFSPVSQRALKIASELAQCFQATLHIVHIVSTEDIPTDILATPEGTIDVAPDWNESIEQKADSQLSSLIEQTLGKEELTSSQITRNTLWGEPWEEITKYSKSVGAGLIVMGTVGRRGLSRLLLGNTAEKVLESCEMSLLSIKPADFVPPDDAPFWSLHPQDK